VDKNRPQSPSPLLLLRGARIAAKVIEDVHVAAARAAKVTKCATNSSQDLAPQEDWEGKGGGKSPSHSDCRSTFIFHISTCLA